MEHGTDISNDKQKAAELLKTYKKRFGLTWRKLSMLLDIPSQSLSVYVSGEDNYKLMPQSAVDRIMNLPASPNLDLDAGSGSIAVWLVDGEWIAAAIPEVKHCRYCSSVFIPAHPQQEYCTTYAGKCGLAMRRKRRKDGAKKKDTLPSPR